VAQLHQWCSLDGELLLCREFEPFGTRDFGIILPINGLWTFSEIAHCQPTASYTSGNPLDLVTWVLQISEIARSLYFSGMSAGSVADL
jgi:hypothetical protein